jgi:hypothetical protein
VQRDAGGSHEVALDLLGLALAEQAVVDTSATPVAAMPAGVAATAPTLAAKMTLSASSWSVVFCIGRPRAHDWHLATSAS